MSLKEKSIKGFFWDFSGRIGLQGVGFVVSIVLARLLSPGEFGLLAIVNVFINLATVFLDFGFSSALVQKNDVKDEHYSAVFYLNFAMGLVLAGIVFLLSPVIGKIYNNSVLTNVTRLMASGIFISSFGQSIRAKLRREMNFRPLSLSAIYAAIFSGIIAMLMAWRGFGVWSLAAQSVIIQLLSILFLYLLTDIRIRLLFSWEALKELWTFSSRLFFSGLIDTLFTNIDSLFIGKLINPVTLGYYYRAKSLENFGFRYTAATLSSVLLPGLSSLQNDQVKLKQAVLKIYNILSFLSFIACGLLLVCGKEIMVILFSKKWESSVLMFQILIAGAFASQIYSLFYNVMLSTGNSKVYFRLNLLHKLLLFASFILIVYFNNLIIYLLCFTAIRILIYFIGLVVISRQLGYEKKLINETGKNIIIYILSVITSLLIQNQINFQNPFSILLITGLIYITIFSLLSYLINKDNISLVYSEIILVFRKRAVRI